MEGVIRRCLRTLLVMSLFLVMLSEVEDMALKKEISVIRTENDMAAHSGEETPEGISKTPEDAADLTKTEKKTGMAAVVQEEPAFEMMLASEKGTGENLIWAEMAETQGFFAETPAVPSVPAAPSVPAVPPVSVPDNDIPSADPSEEQPLIPDIPSADNSASDIPPADIPSADNSVSDIPPADIPPVDNSVSDIPPAGIPSTDDGGSDIPSADIPTTGEDGVDIPGAEVPDAGGGASDIPEGDAPVSEGSDTGSAAEDDMDSAAGDNTETGAGISGFIVDESGMIRGISDMSLAVSDMCLLLPAEGCSGIARGAFLGVTEEIVDVYIPSSITNIEEGAFLGLSSVCKYEVESGNEFYYAENGVLFSDGGSCLLAFPPGRTGIYFVPAGVTRFANDAFEGSMLSKIDARSCALEDLGNLPEGIEVQ